MGKGFSLVSSIVLLGLISRQYGQSGTGVYTLTFTYLSFFYLFVDLGLNGYYLEKYKQNNTVFSTLLNLRLSISIVLIILAVTAAFFLPFSTQQFRVSVLLGSVTIISSAIFNTCNLIFQANFSYKLAAFSNLAGSIATILVSFFLISTSAPVELLPLSLSIGLMLSAFTSFFMAKSNFVYRLEKLDISMVVDLLKKTWPIAATLIINTLYFRIDTFIVASHSGFNESGIYNLSYSLFQTLLVVPTFIMNSYYPMMLQALQQEKYLFILQLRKVFLIMLGIGIIFTLISQFLAPVGVYIIAGSGFLESSQLLKILSLSFPAFFLSAFLIWVFMSLHLYKKMFLIYLGGFFFNLILNLAFIPQYSYLAAAYITVASEYLILIAQITILSTEFKKNEFSR